MDQILLIIAEGKLDIVRGIDTYCGIFKGRKSEILPKTAGPLIEFLDCIS